MRRISLHWGSRDSKVMIPIGDDNTGRTRTPYFTYLLIAANVLVFVLLQGLGSNERFTYSFSTVPREILTGNDVAQPVTVKDPVSGDVAGTFELQPNSSGGLGMLGGGAQAGGVTYGAHIGGFLAGLLLVKLFAAGRGTRLMRTA